MKAGYVRRSPGKDDRRFVVLETTAKAKTLLKKRRPAVQEQFSDALLRMLPKERKELARLLGVFVANAGLDRGAAHFFFEKEPRHD